MKMLWELVSIGRMSLKNRLAVAPMTRDRSTPEGVPTNVNATYYAQRAAFGLIVTEGTQPSDDGQGYLLTPGIYTDDQVAGLEEGDGSSSCRRRQCLHPAHARWSHRSSVEHTARTSAGCAVTGSACWNDAHGSRATGDA
jgi:N-ethylmaleimide reductase